MTPTATCSLSQLFDTVSEFVIPGYQRGYSWGRDKELVDFFNDVCYIAENNGEESHYTGVLSFEPLGNQSFSLIDGQQRIVTSIFLISVLSKYVGDDNTKRRLQKYLYSGDTVLVPKVTYRFDKTSDDRLKSLIGFPDITGLHDSFYTWRMAEAYNFFDEQVHGKSKTEISKLLDAVENRLSFFFFVEESSEKALVNFESLNNRGKILSTLEILKSRFIALASRIPSSQHEVIKSEIINRWSSVYSYLGKSKVLLSDEEFLRVHKIIYFGYGTGDKRNYQNFLLSHFNFDKIGRSHLAYQEVADVRVDTEYEEIGENDENDALQSKNIISLTHDDLIGYATSISSFAEVWYWMNFPDDKDCPYAENLTARLVRFCNMPSRAKYVPLVLVCLSKLNLQAMINRVDLQQPAQDQVCDLIDVVERNIFVNSALMTHRSNYQLELAYRLAHEFYIGESEQRNVSRELEISDVVRAIISLETDHTSFELKIRNSFEDLFIGGKGLYDWEFLNYFLWRYDEDLRELAVDNLASSPNALRYSPSDKLTREHIYPQNPRSDNGYWKKRFKKNSKKLLHNLGNFLLISKNENSELQSKDFPYKCTELYKKNSLSADQVVTMGGNGSEWNPETLLKRADILFRWIDRVYSLKLSEETITYLVNMPMNIKGYKAHK